MLSPSVNVFIDGGGNNRIGMERYLAKFPSFHRIYVFEPNPMFYSSYQDAKFKFINKAIWTSNCKLPFYLSRDQNEASSSLFQDKLCRVQSDLRPNYREESIEVDCIDFSMWIKDNIKHGYNLTLKLDIEGAEYDVLWKMINDKTINLVKRLYAEFHWQALKMDKNLHDELIKALVACGVTPHNWD